MSTTVTSEASLRRRRWRRTYYVRLFISPLPKRSSSSDLAGVSPPPSPPPPASPDVVSPSSSSVPDAAAEPVTSRTSSSKSHVAINIDDIDHELLRKRVARSVRDKDFDSLRDVGGIEQIASLYESDVVNGINGDGGCANAELNVSDQAKGFIYFFLKSCNSYTIFLLLISSGLCFGIDFIDKGPDNGWHDGVAVLFAVFLLVMFPAVANFRRTRKLEEKLMNQKKKLDVQVVLKNHL